MMLSAVAPWWAGIAYIIVMSVTFAVTFTFICHTTIWVWRKWK